MNRAAPVDKSAEFSFLQLALPGKSPVNIGVFLIDTESGRLYKKLRRDWKSIADPENREALELLDAHFDTVINEDGAAQFLSRIEDTLSNVLLITKREKVAVVSDFETVLNLLFEEHVHRTEVIQFVTHVPVYSLRAAATKFGEDMEVEAEGWARAPERMRLSRHMFAARVVGRSMEPVIPDGSLCLFHGAVVGSRQGKRLLIQRLGATDSSAEFTVKVYTSQKIQTGEEQWEHVEITMKPLNPKFEAMVFRPEDEHNQFRVVAEFVQVLEEPA